MKLKNAKRIIELNVNAQINKDKYQTPVVLAGKPGLGKTATLKQIAEELDMELYTVSIPLTSMETFSGLPLDVKIGEQEAVRWSAPEMVAQINSSERGVILFIDDLHLASEAVQSYMFELLIDKKIKQHKIKKDCAIIGAMNDSEKAGMESLFSPVRNRISILSVDLEFEEWFKSFGSKLNPLITSFLNTNKQYFQEEESTDLSGFATPRVWEGISNMIDEFEEQNEMQFFESVMYDMFKGYVSPECATDLTKHIRYILNINFEEIVKNKEPLKLETVKEQVLYSYIVKYINTKTDAEYFYNELKKNVDKKLFITFAFSNIYYRYREMMKSKKEEVGVRNVVELILNDDSKESIKIVDLAINAME